MKGQGFTTDTTITTPDAQERLKIDIWTDVECPWCFIGKRRLDEAIASSKQPNLVEVVLHSFQLEPKLSSNPIRNVDRVAAKYRLTRKDAAEMDGKVAAIAHREGLPFAADRILANTFDVHRVLQLASVTAYGGAFFDHVQRALFTGQVNIFDHAVLTDLAVEAGLSRDRVEQVLQTDDFTNAVLADQAEAARLGITGIPFTVLGGKLAIPGSTTVEGFAEAIRRAWSGL